jgi:hypothetical protein
VAIGGPTCAAKGSGALRLAQYCFVGSPIQGGGPVSIVVEDRNPPIVAGVLGGSIDCPNTGFQVYLRNSMTGELVDAHFDVTAF